MSTDIFSEVARLMGVKLDEPFIVKNHWEESLVKLDKRAGLVCWLRYSGKWSTVTGCLLNEILAGNYEIIKKVYTPINGEEYWTYEGEFFDVVVSEWEDSALDYARLKSGMVFLTEEDAMEEQYEVYEKITGKKDRNRGVALGV